MSENRKYYFFKLKETYFESNAVTMLESLPEGEAYSYLLLKLYLRALSTEGKLEVAEGIPLSAEAIARYAHKPVEFVQRAIEAYIALGLMEKCNNGSYYLSEIELLVGKSSTQGDRMRAARNRIRQENSLTEAPDSAELSESALSAQKNICTSESSCSAYSSPVKLGENVNICSPEIDIETEIDTEQDREIEDAHEAARQPERPRSSQACGRYKNVFISSKERRELDHEVHDLDTYIEHLSEYIASTNKRYGNHAATIRRWATQDSMRKSNENALKSSDSPNYAERTVNTL